MSELDKNYADLEEILELALQNNYQAAYEKLKKMDKNEMPRGIMTEITTRLMCPFPRYEKSEQFSELIDDFKDRSGKSVLEFPEYLQKKMISLAFNEHSGSGYQIPIKNAQRHVDYHIKHLGK